MSDDRYREHLRRRYRVIGRALGFLFLLNALLMLLPLILLIWTPQEWWLAPAFVLAAGILALAGWLLRRTEREQERLPLSLAEGSVVVVLAWLSAISVGALPFCWAGLSVSQAFFETTSGWTTTGLSVVDVTSCPALLLFYRSLLQLAGGAGLAILLVSLLAIRGSAGLNAAEGHNEQLVPQVRHSARLVIRLYGGYVVVGLLGLKLAGMSWFDAVNHAFCALSTGGFSTHAAPLAQWASPAAQTILILLMLLGMTNFLTAYTLLCGRWHAVWRNGELRLAVVLLGMALFALCWHEMPRWQINDSLEQFRISLFQIVSALSTTGFVITDIEAGDNFCWLLLILLMLVGGGNGSTAGGIKQQRLLVLLKSVKQLLWQFSHPPHEVHEEILWTGDQKRPLTLVEVSRAGSYVLLYLATWLAGSLVLTAYGHDMARSLFEFASTLGTVGLSLGLTNPDVPPGQLWLQSAGMLLGRLEFLVLFWGLTRLAKEILPLLTPRNNRPRP